MLPKRILFILVFCLGLPLIAAVATGAQSDGTVPSGFIARPESPMNWKNAVAYCQQQGGRLPLINGSAALRTVPNGATIEGFGTNGGPWPSGLYGRNHWTGTEYIPGKTWTAFARGGKVAISDGNQDNRSVVYTICVPK